jgi:GNAT superfamily N-acetyltransferase
VIRPATDADARAIAELEVRAWRWAYTDVVAEEDMITVAEREPRWRGPAAAGTWVAEVEGRVVGVVQARTDPGDPATGLLDDLAVEPAAQGAGLGTALYDHALAQLRAAGCQRAALWVFTGNGHARGLLERRGWTADGATATAAGAPRLRYRKDLRS